MMPAIFRTIRTVCAATVFGLAATTAHATTVATFGIVGNWETQSPETEGDGRNTFSFAGTFDGDLYPFDPFLVTDYEFSAELLLGPQQELLPGEPFPGVSVFDESIVIEDISLFDILIFGAFLVELALEEASTDDIDFLEDLVDYIVGNTGTPFLLDPYIPGSEFQFSYSEVLLTETTIDGNFDFTFRTPFPLSPLPNNAGGTFAVNLAITDVAPIPLPASAVLLLGALGAGIALGRRRRQSI